MNKIALLTATYNHPEKLQDLYSSLKTQSYTKFDWVIVDDGSRNETELIISKFIKEDDISIVYLKKDNGGKASAVNLGLDYVGDNRYDFVLFIDDDERILPDGVKLVVEYIEKYKDTDCGVIHFNRIDENGKIIANPVFLEDQIMTCQERKRRRYHQDGYTGYYVDRLGDLRFPSFEGEKYVGPSLLFMMLCDKGYKMVWAYKAIGKTEYLEAGITKQGRRLRIKNPKGMYYYCLLLQNKNSGLILRFIYSIYGYAYLAYGGILEKDIRATINTKYRLIRVTKPIGLLVSKIWNRKYMSE